MSPDMVPPGIAEEDLQSPVSTLPCGCVTRTHFRRSPAVDGWRLYEKAPGQPPNMDSPLLDVSLYQCPHGHYLLCEHNRLGGDHYVRHVLPNTTDPHFCFYLLLRTGRESWTTACQVREMLARIAAYSLALPPEAITRTDGRGRTWHIILRSQRLAIPQVVCQDTWFVTDFPPYRRDAVDFPDEILAWVVGTYYHREVTMYNRLAMRGPPEENMP